VYKLIFIAQRKALPSRKKVLLEKLKKGDIGKSTKCFIGISSGV
jgi:hypothetical protein